MMSDTLGKVQKDLNIKYVTGKIKSIKWRPSHSPNEHSSTFVAGSWDDLENVLSVWHVEKDASDPTLIQEIIETNDVNCIQYVSNDALVIASGDGSVKLYHQNTAGLLSLKHSWEHCHRLNSGSAACTAVAAHGNQVVSVGEDGKTHLFNPKESQSFKQMDNEGECSIYAVTFVTSHEFITGNMQGHLKLWDIRARDPLKATLLSPDQVPVRHLSRHPTQQHLISSSMDDGTLALWDMRATSQPFVLISAHEGSILESEFHPSASDHLFSCGADGKVVHWDASAAARKSNTLATQRLNRDSSFDNSRSSMTNAWFSDDVKRGFVDGVSLVPESNLPINCISVNGDTLLAGSDNECVYVINNVLYE